MRSLTGLLLSLFVLSIVEGKSRYNSFVLPPNNIQFSDVTGDNVDEFYLYHEDKVFVTTTEATIHGIAYFKLQDITNRIFSGKFVPSSGAKKGILCAQEPTPNIIECWALDNNNNPFLLFSQPDFVGPVADNHVITGDYNGDGQDDTLVYTVSTGLIKMFTYDSTQRLFITMANWAVGDAGGFANSKIYAADYMGADGIADVMITRANGDMDVYKTQVVGGQYSFKLQFNYPGAIPAGCSLLPAAIDIDGNDDVIYIDPDSGDLTFGSVEDGLPSIEVSDANVYQAVGFQVFVARLGADTDGRDDFMIYANDKNPKVWVRSDAIQVGTELSYEISYMQVALALPEDPDQDGLITAVELGGNDPNNDGVSDGIEASFGASPFMKDVFLQVDFMDGIPEVPERPDYSLTDATIIRAQNDMKDKDINLHIFQQNKVEFQENLGSPDFNWERDFDPIKKKYFCALQPERVPFFHYCLVAKRYDNGVSTGLSRNTPGSDYIVTLEFPDPPQQVGTLLHELGHNLGLKHGSVDNVGFKPNHLSIMNYDYQRTGIQKNGLYKYFYSEVACDSVDENALSETGGIKCTVGESNVYYNTRIYSSDRWNSVNFTLDWNENKKIDPATYKDDTNSDGEYTTLAGGVNEYNLLDFSGGVDGFKCPPNTRSTRVGPLRPNPKFAKFGTQVLHSPVWYPSHLFSSEAQALRFLNHGAKSPLAPPKKK